MKILKGGKIALPQSRKSSGDIRISSIEETEIKNKYFKHLNDRFNNNYSGRIDGSLDSLDEKLVIDNISAFENTLNQFKEIHPYIKPQIMAANLGRKTYGAAYRETGHMILNKTKYKDGKSTSLRIKEMLMRAFTQGVQRHGT